MVVEIFAGDRIRRDIMKINYQKKLDQLISSLGENVPRLLLHSCCAPCSSYCIEYLSQYFDITILYYDPNIYPEEEFYKRAAEQQRLVSQMPLKHPVKVIVDEYEPQQFYSAVKGMEHIPEGGERLERAAEYAAENGFEYFCSTLTISPLKNAEKLNEIGETLTEIYPVKHLPSDFKKRNGYKRSIELSREYGLYRQNYCGCAFSKAEAMQREAQSDSSGK